VFLHLKKALDAGQIDWVDCQRSEPGTKLRCGRSLTAMESLERSGALAAIKDRSLTIVPDNEATPHAQTGYRMMTETDTEQPVSLPLTDKGA